MGFDVSANECGPPRFAKPEQRNANASAETGKLLLKCQAETKMPLETRAPFGNKLVMRKDGKNPNEPKWERRLTIVCIMCN